MKRRIFSLFLAFCLALSLLPTALAAPDHSSIDGGDCGASLHWNLTSVGSNGSLGELTIYGEGSMKSYREPSTNIGDTYDAGAAPWYQMRRYDSIARLVLEEGVTSIGYSAFHSCSGLTGELVLPSTLTSIGSYAFWGCNFNGSVTIPASVSQISYHSLANAGLTGIIFEGNAPQIDEGAFDGDITLYFRAGTTGWTDSPYYSASMGTWKGYTLRRIGGDDLDEKIPGSIHWATFDAQPGRFPDTLREGDTFTATERMNGSYLMPQVPADPVREGYLFAGWRISRVDNSTNHALVGQIVRDLSDLDFPGDMVFEAQWEEENTPPYRIDFDPNGGRITSIRGFAADQIVPGTPTAVDNDIFVDKNSGIGMMMTGENGRLDSFPAVEREGYTLLGWGVSEKNLASTSTTFSQDTQLTAYWAKGEGYTVTFNLNGKSGTVPQSQQVAAGGRVDLPAAPVASDGARFVWWGYSEDGRTLKEWKASYPVNGNLTLYAAWEDSVAADYFGYSFGNNAPTFGYPSHYHIPYDSFVLIFGDTPLAVKEHKEFGEWFGNCYGMSATSVMFTTDGNTSNVSSFRRGASLPKDLAVGDRNSGWGINLTKFIEAMHVSQGAYDSSVERGWNLRDLDGMCQEVLAAKAAGQGYPLISFWGYTSTGLSGHTVVGYDLVSADASTSRLMVYDPNYPNNTERYITLYKNGSGNYTGWSYRFNNTYDWGSSSLNMITYNTYDCYASVWRDPGSASPAVLMNIASDSAVVRDKAGNTVATVQNGAVTSNRTDVAPVMLTDAEWSGTAVWLPVDSYTVTNTDKTSKTFDVTMTHVNQSAAVSTTGSTVSFTVDDGKQLNYVELDGAGAEYTITLASSLGTGPKDVRLSGKVSGSALTFAQSGGKLYSTEVKNCQLQIDGVSVPAEKNLSSDLSDIGLADGPTLEVPSGTAFTDVPANSWYAGAVAYVAGRGLMSGTGNGKFSPQATTTRGMVMTMLARMNGVDTSGGSTWYEKGMQWAKAQGISDGSNPGGTITREQLVTMLYRYTGDSAAAGDLSAYPDASAVSKWAVEGVQWAVAHGLISGTDTGALDPRGTATRAQVATIIMRFCEEFSV